MAKTRMPTGDYKRKLVLLPPDLLEKLEREAAKQHRSVNGQLVHSLYESLTQAKDDAPALTGASA